ncbi:divergent polysaccharide deacetylase family protein [Pelagibaculum spongiae]|nr:divergent polysaccharide deacetylase family protein [Pelagibaculum spongiae]
MTPILILLLRLFSLLAVYILSLSQLSAQPLSSTYPEHSKTPLLAIVVDDLGNKSADLEFAKQHWPLTLSVLPFTPYGKQLATLAHNNNKQVMLHMPMQSISPLPLHPGTLTLDMTHHEFDQVMIKSLASIPFIEGINNHQGSLLTRHSGHMKWLMTLLKKQQLFFLDSRTHAATVAEELARDSGLLTGRRHVFLDNSLDSESLNRQFNHAIKLAKKKQFAVAICHPHKETLQFLKQNLFQLQEQGIKLVRLSDLLLEKNHVVAKAF